MEVLEKAWKISAKNLSEPWYFDDVVVIAKTRGEARSKGLSELRQLGAEKLVEYKYDDSDLYYIDISARRLKDHDIVQFEDIKGRRFELKSKLWQKERDEKALQLTITNPNDLAVVRAGVYSSYWGANHSGYSSSIVFAGKYSTEEAYKIVKGSSYDRQETVHLVNIDEFNYDIDKQIAEKQKEIDRLISYKL